MILLDIAILILLVLEAVVFFIFLARRNRNNQDRVLEKFAEYEKRLDRNELSLKDEFGRNREEIDRSARGSREELNTVFANFTGILEGKLRGILESVDASAKANREELAASLKSFEGRFAESVRGFNELQREKFGELVTRQDALSKNTREIFDKIRESVEKKLSDIQTDNSAKLEKMRETVDEKLHKTLETRLGESFQLVSERLEQVQKGLGEMQTLATGVGDLKKVLSNVKTRGVLGEYQLEALLEQLLSPAQYARNVKTKAGSNDMVEFAVKIPSKEDSARIIWLPIDAKFPSEDYERLITAYDGGNGEEIDRFKRDLDKKIRSFARDIKTKYVDPPNTTDFAIMFLPFESLYAEVLRIPGLFETIQREFKITITGPTTISAFLSSLQMGFRSLAVEKRTSEIWELLGAVRTEFGKFGEVLQKTKEKLDSASKEIDRAGTRSRAIERRLRDVQTLPEGAAQKLLGASEFPVEEENV
ncbi:MAG: DNA recombination protein RmuC [Treponema sp.]|jgi:DNA recombination protein RmuC|nr:DNA recombination protein RmuC [Treponema sp.]